MSIVEAGSYCTIGDKIIPIPPGFWPSMEAISKYVSEESGVIVEFPEPEEVKSPEGFVPTEAGECTCECSCYSCESEDCPFR